MDYLRRPEFTSAVSFVLAAVAGTFVIFSSRDWMVSASLASLTVLAFAVSLGLRKKYARWTMEESDHDAPYVLGFVLTQVALLHVCLAVVDAQSAQEDRGGVILTGIAGALATSVVGLICRHLFVIHKAEADKRAVTAESVRQELERNLVGFSRAQKVFADVLTEIQTTTREFASSIEGIMGGHANIQQKIDRMVVALDSHGAYLDTTLRRSRDSVAEFLQSSHERLDLAGAESRELLGRFTRETTDQFAELAQKLGSLEGQMLDSVSSLTTLVIKIERDLVHSSLPDVFGELAAAATEARSGMQALGSHTIRFQQEVEPIADGCKHVARQFREIDNLLGDFVSVAESRIQQIEQSAAALQRAAETRRT